MDGNRQELCAITFVIGASRLRQSRTFTVSLPPDLVEEIDRVAAAENRSRRELVREALRQYVERLRRWRNIFAYGERAARGVGVKSEVGVARTVEEFRRSKRVRRGYNSTIG